MQLTDSRISFSPSDLAGYLACSQLTTLELKVAAAS
jgi:hypothetical protein